tara:strand:+ start:858 stop:1007 length:150 start_codon:yes stop_codon:yes gene_type:complete
MNNKYDWRGVDITFSERHGYRLKLKNTKRSKTEDNKKKEKNVKTKTKQR